MIELGSRIETFDHERCPPMKPSPAYHKPRPRVLIVLLGAIAM